MKRFLLSFILLSGVVGSAWADTPADGKVSRWTNKVESGSMSVETSSNTLKWFATNTSDVKQLFLMEAADGGKHYLRSVYNGRYVKGLNANSAWSTVTKASRESLYLNNNSTYYNVSYTNSSGNNSGNNAGANNTVLGYLWASGNGRSWWSVTNVATTYDVYDIVVTGLANNDNVAVTTTASPAGATSLKNGEAFFFTSGTAVSQSNFSAADVAGYAKEITVANNVITVTYASQTATYNVSVEGCASGAAIYDNQEYADGSQIQNVSLNQSLLSAKSVSGYVTRISVVGTDIIVKYFENYTFDSATVFKNKIVSAVGNEQTSAITPSTSQWYVVKNSRNGLSPLYENTGTSKVARAAANVSVNANDLVADVKTYLVRFVPSYDVDGAVYIQFATGNFWGQKSPVSGSNGGGDVPVSTTAGDYRVYTATQATSGWVGHFAINYTDANTQYGWKIDNNGAGSGVVYWNSGQTTSSSNNIWALYPVTISDLAPSNYTCHVTGNSSGRIVYNNNEYADGETIENIILDNALLSAAPITGWQTELTVSGHDIYVEYWDNTRYSINFPHNQEYTRSDRHIDTVNLTQSGEDTQSSSVTSSKCYQDLTNTVRFVATAGSTVVPKFGYTGNAMYGYVYVDWANDGSFADDMVSQTANGSSLGQNLPSFEIPENAVPGEYRMRWKIDWDYADPAGNPGPNNYIITNGGSITDVTLVVVAPVIPNYLAGDMDSDGLVTISDVAAVADVVAGLATTTSIADANNDGVVNADDVTYAQNVLLGVSQPIDVDNTAKLTKIVANVYPFQTATATNNYNLVSATKDNKDVSATTDLSKALTRVAVTVNGIDNVSAVYVKANGGENIAGGAATFKGATGVCNMQVGNAKTYSANDVSDVVCVSAANDGKYVAYLNPVYLANGVTVIVRTTGEVYYKQNVPSVVSFAENNVTVSTSTASNTGNCWMATIPSSTMHSMLSIPGAHDAATSGLSGAYKCQSLTIAEQLNKGVRFFDLRPYVTSTSNTVNNMYIYHGSSSTGVLFKDAIATIANFLAANPTETVIVEVQEEDGSSNGSDKQLKWCELVSSVFDSHASQIVRQFKPNQTLGDFRGKMGVLAHNSFNAASTGWVQYGAYIQGWPGATAAHTTSAVFWSANETGTGNIAQANCYSASMLDDYNSNSSTKNSRVSTLLGLADTDTTKSRFYLTCTNSASGLNPSSNANSINPATTTKLGDMTGRAGVISADYIGSSSYGGQNLLNAIMGQNHKYIWTPFTKQ